MFPVWYNERRIREYWFQDFDKYKEMQQHRWGRFLERWSNVEKTTGSGEFTMGTWSGTVIDQFVWGERKFQEPPPYERVVDEFIRRAESCGVDPARHFHETIKKMVDAYYPIDLDPNPEETKRVLKPKIQWVYPTDLDEYVVEEESKPRPNSIARYLWYIPGFQDFFSDLKSKAQQSEQELIGSMTPEERQCFYEQMEAFCDRTAMEINDYLPLLAYRWDRKLKLAHYAMNPENHARIEEILTTGGGFKQLLIDSGVITAEQAVGFDGRVNEY